MPCGIQKIAKDILNSKEAGGERLTMLHSLVFQVVFGVLLDFSEPCAVEGTSSGSQ